MFGVNLNLTEPGKDGLAEQQRSALAPDNRRTDIAEMQSSEFDITQIEYRPLYDTPVGGNIIAAAADIP